MGCSDYNRGLSTLEVLLVEVDDLSQVHGLELFEEILPVHGHKDDLGADKHVKILVLIIGKVEHHVSQVDSVLILCGLPLDLIDCVEGKWSFELREALAEAGDQASGLIAEGNDFEVLGETLQHSEALLLDDVVLALVEVTEHTVQVQDHNGKLGSLGLESFLGDEQPCRDAVTVLVRRHSRVILRFEVLGAGWGTVFNEDAVGA